MESDDDGVEDVKGHTGLDDGSVFAFGSSFFTSGSTFSASLCTTGLLIGLSGGYIESVGKEESCSGFDSGGSALVLGASVDGESHDDGVFDAVVGLDGVTENGDFAGDGVLCADGLEGVDGLGGGCADRDLEVSGLRGFNFGSLQFLFSNIIPQPGQVSDDGLKIVPHCEHTRCSLVLPLK